MTNDLPNNRGGARPGAGRRSNAAKGLESTQKMTLYLTDAQTAYVRGLAADRSTSPSEVVRAMVTKIMQSERRKNR